ncbi:MAG TPA: IS30 family transposase, partial [Mycobacterium sp.]|nr:IS30 family transposase [Mycobacterium sp.]
MALPDGNTADAVAAALIDHTGRLPTRLRRSLTWDRGCEMVRHAVITTALSMPVFFCDPHHPWQRGTNENTNRLLRQYLHKNADLSTFTQDELNVIAAKTQPPPASSTQLGHPSQGVRHNRAETAAAGARVAGAVLGCDHDSMAAGGLPELDVARVQRWCADKVPGHARGEIRIECDVAPRYLTICECRPPWREDFGPDWTRFPIARLHYTKSSGLWTLYWRDRNL